jgi:multiple sugar transport system ATP-binding protein
MASISLKHIEKIYPNGFHAVHDFNLEIEDKEFIIFVGPSGCGKSTTLRMVQVWKTSPPENSGSTAY